MRTIRYAEISDKKFWYSLDDSGRLPIDTPCETYYNK